ncbi:MAG: sulfatase-like hydrolase/transferase [Planctomycetes bacterium]|nr:sulfatase-like hydrolase/transferase [Planctomycetota bacterium]
MRSTTSTFRAFAILLAFHVLATLPLPWEPGSWWSSSARLSPDLLGIVLCVIALGGSAMPKSYAHVGVVGFAVAWLYRCFETLVPTFYGKPFEPWVDMLELPGLVHLLLHTYPAALQVAMVITAACVFGLVYWLLWRGFRTVAAAGSSIVFASTVVVAFQLSVTFAWLRSDAALRAGVAFAAPSSIASAFEYAVDVYASKSYRVGPIVNERVQAANQAIDRVDTSFASLDSADVQVLFLESYGRGILGNSARERYTNELRRLEARLTDADFTSRTGWVRPRVRGGGSSLAHVEFMSGIPVENRRVFDALLASSIRPLPALLRKAGYKTVNIEPAMPREWPEAAALGFDDDVFRSSFPYRGTKYAWGDMPDQYALARVLRDVVSKERTHPLFLQYVSITGHAPFSMIPPVLEPWERALEDGAFDGPAAKTYDITWLNYAGHPEIANAYVDAMCYSLRVAIEYASKLTRPSLVFVLGDHQPPIAYVDRIERQHDVPMHVITNVPAFAQRLDDDGWPCARGMVPDFDSASIPSSRILHRFLMSFGK